MAGDIGMPASDIRSGGDLNCRVKPGVVGTRKANVGIDANVGC